MRPQDPFELAMRELGYQNFRKERGRYCEQVLNDMRRAWFAGWRAGFQAENSLSQMARKEIANG